jgi:hypothetical protein
MKRTLITLIGVLIGIATLTPVAVTNAASASVEIAIGDRPYYTHGPYYVENGVRWEWVPGHWATKHHKRVWVHGHYARR